MLYEYEPVTTTMTDVGLPVFFGCWRRMRTERLEPLFLSLGLDSFDVTRIMLVQYLAPSSSIVGVVFPAVALTELGSLNRHMDLVLGSDPTMCLWGGKHVHESVQLITKDNSLVWKRRFRIKGVSYMLTITRTVERGAQGQKLMKCEYCSMNEITKSQLNGTSWYVQVQDPKVTRKLPGYFPVWTWGEDSTLAPPERVLAFSLNPALIGRLLAEAESSLRGTVITQRGQPSETPPPIYIQQLLECQRYDDKGDVGPDFLDPFCDPPAWSLCSDAVHADPRPAQLRTLWHDVIRGCSNEGSDMSFADKQGVDHTMLLKEALSFRYRYVPLSTLLQGGDTPSDVALAVLRDFVVLQGDGSSVSSSGSGWQYARDFGMGVDDWVASKEQLAYKEGENLVRRRVWMRLLVAQSNFFRANDLLNHGLFSYRNRYRGRIKQAKAEYFDAAWSKKVYVSSSLTLDDNELTVEPEVGETVRIPIKAAVIRKLARVSSDRKREKNDERCEIELVLPRPEDREEETQGEGKGKGRKGPKLRDSYLFRFKDEEERSDWICALGHQIVLLGGGGKGCYDECAVLKPSPLMVGEMFIEVLVEPEKQTEAETKAADVDSSPSSSASAGTGAGAGAGTEADKQKEEALRRGSLRRGSTAEGVMRKQANISQMTPQQAAAAAAQQLAEEAAEEAAAAIALPPPPPPTKASAPPAKPEFAWQLRRFLLFDGFLESHHCNQDMTGSSAHAPWKIPIVDFAYKESDTDALLMVLDGSERVLRLRAVSPESRAEWREAFRRVLRARSYNALQSTFLDKYDENRRLFTYEEDLVLVVKNNHNEETSAQGGKAGASNRKPTVSQAAEAARVADAKAKGLPERQELDLISENETVVRLRKQEEAARLSSRLYSWSVQVGLLRPLGKAPPLVMTSAVTTAMNKLGLKSSKIFDGSEFLFSFAHSLSLSLSLFPAVQTAHSHSLSPSSFLSPLSSLLSPLFKINLLIQCGCESGTRVSGTTRSDSYGSTPTATPSCGASVCAPSSAARASPWC